MMPKLIDLATLRCSPVTSCADMKAQDIDTPSGSYVIDPDGGDAWDYMASPTPGDANVKVYEGFVEEVQFSPQRGFYEVPLAVTLTTATAGATIWYTTDGSEPYVWTGRVYRGRPYAGPIVIDETMCLKAKAVRPDWRSSTRTGPWPCSREPNGPARISGWVTGRAPGSTLPSA